MVNPHTRIKYSRWSVILVTWNRMGRKQRTESTLTQLLLWISGWCQRNYSFTHIAYQKFGMKLFSSQKCCATGWLQDEHSLSSQPTDVDQQVPPVRQTQILYNGAVKRRLSLRFSWYVFQKTKIYCALRTCLLGCDEAVEGDGRSSRHTTSSSLESDDSVWRATLRTTCKATTSYNPSASEIPPMNSQ